MYFVGSCVVLYNPGTNTQRIYTEHDAEVKWWVTMFDCQLDLFPFICNASLTSIDVNEKLGVACSGQCVSPRTKAHVRVWHLATLETVTVLQNTECMQRSITNVAFAHTRPEHLVCVAFLIDD